jgi:uncharacterized protein (DUF305 family)
MNIRIRLVLLFISAVIFVSCNDDDEDIRIQPGPNEMKVIFDSMAKEIDSVHLVSNPGEDFARIMQVHHKGANDMGRKELEKGNDTTILQIARNMIDRNEVELLEFQDFLNGHTPTVSDAGRTWDAEAKVILDMMRKNADGEILTMDADHDFARLIIVHHKASIEMASSYLRFGTNQNMRSLAQRIIDDQSTEILSLQDWLAKTNL